MNPAITFNGKPITKQEISGFPTGNGRPLEEGETIQVYESRFEDFGKPITDEQAEDGATD